MRVAVLGLGKMGSELAHRLLDGDHDLIVWNRSRGKADDLVANGASEADNVSSAVGGAEVVVTSLANDDAVRAVALGDGGIRSALGEAVYVDCSTVSPGLSAQLGKAFAQFVALPVSGAPKAVRDGTATYLAGGAAADIDAIQPVLDSLSGTLKRFARPELASIAKLTVNLLLLSGVVTLAESVTLARAGGLSRDDIVDLLGESPMVAPGIRNRFDAVLDGSGPAWWSIELGAKDTGLMVATADDLNRPLRLGKTVREVFQAAEGDGLGDEDIATVVRIYGS